MWTTIPRMLRVIDRRSCRVAVLWLLGGACYVGPSPADEPGGTDEAGPPPSGTTPELPRSSAACPALVDGMVTFTVDGVAREARVWLAPAAAAAMDGPVVFYWYGTGGAPDQAMNALGDGVSAITQRGGLVVAPVHINGGAFPWLDDSEADHRLVDEVVACADETLGIDAQHVHALGFSAGGLHTTGLSFARSSYVASVATYSGGGTGALQDPAHVPSALIMHGGPSDVVSGFDFQIASTEYFDAAIEAGGYAALCDHGGGHSIPGQVGPDVTQFLLDHPFGVGASTLPAGLSGICAGP